ncbi:MAG: response regulator [Thermodesulfobacteriota bacterium]|nr:response regulator [Thermodesulfobacteriota bacterium]
MKDGREKKRILFVDDEPNILQGLRRMLRSIRHEWEMKFAKSGSEALEMLAREPFDVIVSDMRMPSMDGAQLLTQVQKRYPMIVRIVLSGYSDQETILKSVLPAHQYLFKPCDPELLISTVNRSCVLRDLLNRESLKQVISRTEYLPSLPTLYTEMMEEIRSSNGSIQRIGKIVEKDLSITAKILQLVNSAFFGLSRHISNPSQAVILLGFNTIRSLVLTVGMFSKFDQATLAALPVKNIYEHSIKTGAIARDIAKMENMDKEQVDNAFMAGMLHDLGKLLFVINYTKTYREVFEISRKREMTFVEVEIEKLGASHTEVGAYLLGLWGLPDTIVEAVAFHHNPGSCSTTDFNILSAVYAANILEHRSHATAGMEGLEQDFDEEYLQKTGINERINAWKDISQQIELEADNNEQ